MRQSMLSKNNAIRALLTALENRFGAHAFEPEGGGGPDSIGFTSVADRRVAIWVWSLEGEPAMYSVQVEYHGPEFRKKIGELDNGTTFHMEFDIAEDRDVALDDLLEVFAQHQKASTA